MTFRTTEHGPILLTPQELLLSRLPGLLSLWKHDRDRGTGAYRTAQDLVAAWSGLQRLVLPQDPGETFCRVDEAIRDDTSLFLEAIVSHDFDCESWLREMEKLDTDWDLGREKAEDLEWRTREAFDALDRTELFAWFAATKVPSDARIQAWLESVSERCEGTEQFIADRPDLFLCLATDLAAVIASSRPGLEETHPLLWETLGKHRRIEEARDEVEQAPSRHDVLTRVAESVSAESAEPVSDRFSRARVDTDSVKKPLFKIGENVLLRSTKELGRVERDATLDGGEYWYRVRFTKRIDNVVEEDLEPLVDPAETLESLTARGSWGRIQAFRSALAVERIINANQSTIYAFRAQRVLFEAFQYKPLLKMLESPDRRLLIADEVGLGKTVEAGLILAELEARQPLDRVLVVCPSRLREKWRDEMSRKFGKDFDLANRSDLEEHLARIRRAPSRSRLRAVVSMQTLRNKDLREQFLSEVGFIDLVIVDEAHHARNPSAQTSEMLRELCEIAGAVLLLTATPLHLGNRDLFTLLQALRPSEFRDYAVFDQHLRRYKGVHEAALLVRAQKEENLVRVRQILADLFQSRVLRSAWDPLAVQIIEDLEGSIPQDRRSWVELERRVQDLHPLSSILTRTRKRDVQEMAAIRRARVFRCQWTPEEDEAYRKLILGSGSLGWINQRMSIGQIQRARQAASCLPATLAAVHKTARLDDEAVELTDILPEDLPASGLPPDSGCLALPSQLRGQDSKLEKLVELLGLVQQEEPDAKVLIFTFFVGTSRYLQDRLTARGFPALRIAGDVPSDPKRPDKDERGKVMRRFREDSGIRVLVSTEVGSEGLDFQFCHYLVNYDLPWNPMVVEQRIGRIDRFGQQSKQVHIWNIVVEGTVEDRILYRLYKRIGLFRESIGQLEAILGEQISELQRDYVSGKLTPEEAEQRVEQAARAIEERRARLEELEQKAGNLFGHEEYVKEQLRRVGRLGRYISEKSMLALIESYLPAKHPTVRIWEEPVGVYHLRLSDDLRREIQDASSREDLWVDRGRKGVFSFCFDGEQAYHHPEVDLINVSHPFLRAAVSAVRKQFEDVFAKAAKGVLVLSSKEDEDLEEGTYFILVFVHALASIQTRRILETIAWSEKVGGILSSEGGERLLHLVQERGAEDDASQPAPALPQETWARMVSEARTRNRILFEAEKRENEALYVRRRTLFEAEFEHDRTVKATRLQTAQARGRTRVIPALEGQMQKAEAIFRSRIAELERTREVRCSLSDPIAACLVKVVQSST
jgi:ATP-dependent helicase HepA